MRKLSFLLMLVAVLIIQSCTDRDSLVLRNQLVSFSFKEGTYSLTQMTDLVTKKDHILPDSLAEGLWKLTFAKDDTLISCTNSTSRFAKASITTNDMDVQTLKILWDSLEIMELSDIKVEVAINLPESSGIAEWHINVINSSKEWGLLDVNFPVVAGLLDTCNYDLYGSFGNRDDRGESWGALYKGYKGRLDLRYPDGWGAMSMQFMGANNGTNGVYMATHDPRAWKKNFVIEPGNEFYVKIFAENMDVAGSGFNDPFPFLFGVFQGDWLYAAKKYREFAITTPWAAKGKVSKAASTPQSFKDVALWIRAWKYDVTDSGEFQNKLNTWKWATDFFGVPLGFHWYNWNIYPFDTHYPHFFPAQKGVNEFAKELTNMGVVVMPYINGRIVDKRNDDLDALVPFAAKKQNSDTYEEIYSNGVPQMVMCPTCEAYQDTIANAIKKLADDIGVNSVYIDQITAAPSNLCYDQSHGHPLGGGSF